MRTLDYPNPIGSFWGEVQANLHRALGAVGTVTNGGVRDLDEMQEVGFFAFASCVLVSHAYVHITDIEVPVKVGGLEVSPGDIIQGDQHGVIKVPRDIAADIPAAVKRVEDGEQEMIGYANSSEFHGRGSQGDACPEVLREMIHKWDCSMFRGVGDPQGERFQIVEALVDTGATFSIVPAPILDGLGSNLSEWFVRLQTAAFETTG